MAVDEQLGQGGTGLWEFPGILVLDERRIVKNNVEQSYSGKIGGFVSLDHERSYQP